MDRLQKLQEQAKLRYQPQKRGKVVKFRKKKRKLPPMRDVPKSPHIKPQINFDLVKKFAMMR